MARSGRTLMGRNKLIGWLVLHKKVSSRCEPYENMAARAYIGSINVTMNPRTINTIAIALSPIVILLFREL